MRSKEEIATYQKQYYLDHKAELGKRNTVYMRNYRKRPEVQQKFVDDFSKRQMYWSNRWRTVPECSAIHRKNINSARSRCKLQCLEHYSNGKLECACCHDNTIEFLTIDHVNGGGNKHHRLVANHVHEWLVSHKFPEGYRVLCMNCNWVIGKIGYCPHQNKLKEN